MPPKTSAYDEALRKPDDPCSLQLMHCEVADLTYLICTIPDATRKNDPMGYQPVGAGNLAKNEGKGIHGQIGISARKPATNKTIERSTLAAPFIPSTSQSIGRLRTSSAQT